jgi:thiol-disulfide isomerase/thioredoxin
MKTYSISNILVLIFWIFLIFLFLNELFARNTNELSKNTIEPSKNTDEPFVNTDEPFVNTDEPFENTNKNKISVYNFNTTWCGHSKNFQPVWDKFAESINVSDNILTIDAKCDTNINDKLVKKYEVHGFPTVIIDNGKSFNKYSGERSVNGLRKALNLLPINDNMVVGNQNRCGGQNDAPRCGCQNNAPRCGGKNQGVQDNDAKTRIFNFNTSWCGYSVRFQPEWDVFQKEVNAKRDLTHVEAYDIKCDDPSFEQMCKNYDVPGFPTVIIEKGPNKKVYQGPRTSKSLIETVEQMLN